MSGRYFERALLALSLCATTTVPAQDILSFEGGYLTFTNSNSELFYHVEFKLDLSDSTAWSDHYHQWNNIQTNASTITVPIGKFFRVVGTSEPRRLGTAAPSDILHSRTVFINGQEVVGTMPAIVSANILPGTLSQVIPAGYHDGTGTIAGDTALAPGNIRSGTSIFGVPGSFVQAAVPRTGQTVAYRTRDDGNLQRGVAPPVFRFIDNNDGTVTDLVTNLMWVKNPHALSGNSSSLERTWQNGMDFSNGVAISNFAGYNDWRMPNVRELHSLVDYGLQSLALPSGHPFINVQSALYWSSTTSAMNTMAAWAVRLTDGSVEARLKGDQAGRIWPVRGGY